MYKTCTVCKQSLKIELFFRKDKTYLSCNECSIKLAANKKNSCEACGISACFNEKGSKIGRFCSLHKKEGMIDIMHKTCIHPNCIIYPAFNYEGEKKRIYCNTHKLSGMVDLSNKTCIHPDCKSRALYNLAGESKGLYCNTHKLIGMIDVKHKTCIHSECKVYPIFNIEGETKGLYCNIHKLPGMINIKSKNCIHLDSEDPSTRCKTTASYNNEGETKGLYCNEHKLTGMVNVITKTCIYPECNTIPTFNYEEETKGLYCASHRLPGMIDIKNKTCIYPDCKTIPAFNYEGETKRLYCNTHKLEGMINITNKSCIYLDCKIYPSFNYEGETKGLYCASHRLSGMVDIKNKTCIHPECKSLSSFGYCNSPLSHCGKHKLDFMFYRPKRTCIGNDEEECKESAIYGKNEPLHCEEHKLEDDICWLVRSCSNCERDKEILNKDNLCSICCETSFYNKSKKVNKLKESIMVKYLRNNLKEAKEILADTIIDSKCNLYRPDILYDCGTHIVVIECDENQHKNYNWESCSLNRSLEHAEEKRMYEIMIAYGLPTIFIRWNPDKYKINDTIINKYNSNKRLEILVKWINHCFKMNIKEGIIYKKLFYDNYKEEDISFKKIEEHLLL